jgi:S1-C subfamily serine protease
MLDDRYPNKPDGQEKETPTNPSAPDQNNPANPGQDTNSTARFNQTDLNNSNNTAQYPYWHEIYSDQSNRTQTNPYQSPTAGGYTPAGGTTNPYNIPPTNNPNPYRTMGSSTNPYATPAADGGYTNNYRTIPTAVDPNPAPAAPVKRRGVMGLLIAINGIFLVAIVALLVVFLLNNNAKTITTAPPPTAAQAVAPANTKAASNPTATSAPVNNQAAAAPTAAVQPATSNGTDLSVRQVAEKVKPAVVQVSNMQKQQVNPFGGRRGSSNGTNSSQPVEAGVGSGIIYDKAGYILTNNHVVTGADALLVTLPDGRSFPATVVGTDLLTDLAVIKINPQDETLPVADLGDSSQLHVGDGVVAIGNALALPGGPTVTSGVVSALDRSVAEPGSTGPNGQTTSTGPTLYGLVQTDAAINPGNSGGPLVNLQGQVIGINTLGAGEAEPGVQAQGIGFAISINQAKDIAQQLVASGKVSHAYMGIAYVPLTPAIASQLGVSLKDGAVLSTVQSGTPAAAAGLKEGDIIVSADGKQLVGESALGEILNGHKPGDKITLQVVTPQSQGGSGQPRNVDITLGERPAGQ